MEWNEFLENNQTCLTHERNALREMKPLDSGDARKRFVYQIQLLPISCLCHHYMRACVRARPFSASKHSTWCV